MPPDPRPARIRNVISSRAVVANEIRSVVSEAKGRRVNSTGILPKRSDKTPYARVETPYAIEKPGTNQLSPSGCTANLRENAGMRGATM
jgi:hypothetical protein